MRVSDVLRTKKKAKQALTSTVATVSPRTPIPEAARELRALNIGALVVAGEQGTVAGIITERDIVDAVVDHAGDLTGLTVADLMTTQVTCCRPDDDATAVMTAMSDHRMRHMPVVETGQIVGLISVGDVVKQRLSEIEAEARALHEYMFSGR